MKRLFFLFIICIFFVVGCSSNSTSKMLNKNSKTTVDSDKQSIKDDSQEKTNDPFFGKYQNIDEFSKLIEKNPIDSDYEYDLRQLNNSKNFGTQTSVELEDKYARIWDRELNEIYRKLLAKLNEKEKKLLEESQKSWFTYHQKEVGFVWQVFYLRPEGQIFGSQGRVQISSANKDRLRERTLQLMEYYYILGGKVEFSYQGNHK